MKKKHTSSRDRLIVRLRESRYTFRKIAGHLGITKQRVHQIFLKYKREHPEYVEVPRVPPFEGTCRTCKKPFTTKPRKATPKFCSSKCYGGSRRIYADRKEKDRAGARRWYHRHKGGLTRKESGV